MDLDSRAGENYRDATEVFSFDPRYVLKSRHICYSFVRAAVTSLETSPETTASMSLRLVTVSLYLDLPLNVLLALFIISLVFKALIFILYLVRFCHDL